ncbi:hypothetical protein PM082_016241 [Marasmius tenuissimus]|nr:hypothetical protein PM082_016241 [Marasmius tenuissimus]
MNQGRLSIVHIVIESKALLAHVGLECDYVELSEDTFDFPSLTILVATGLSPSKKGKTPSVEAHSRQQTTGESHDFRI